MRGGGRGNQSYMQMAAAAAAAEAYTEDYVSTIIEAFVFWPFLNCLVSVFLPRHIFAN